MLQSFYSAFVFHIQISVSMLPGLLWRIIGCTEKEPKDWQRVTKWAPLRNSISLKPTHVTRWVHWTVSVSGKSIPVIQLLCSAVTNVFPRAASTICDESSALALQVGSSDFRGWDGINSGWCLPSQSVWVYNQNDLVLIFRPINPPNLRVYLLTSSWSKLT